VRWYHYVAYFFGGAFFANAVPHFVNGVSGHPFQSPFASPPGEGWSSSMVNVLWGFFNLAVGYVLVCRVVSPPVPEGTKIAEIAGNQGRAPDVQRVRLPAGFHLAPGYPAWQGLAALTDQHTDGNGTHNLQAKPQAPPQVAIVSPNDRKPFQPVRLSTGEEVREAVTRARAARLTWRLRPLAERVAALRAAAKEMLAGRNERGRPSEPLMIERRWNKTALVATVAFTQLAPGCGGGAQSTSDANACGGLSPAARQFLAELVKQTQDSLGLALTSSGTQDLNFEFALPGIDMMQGSNEHLAMPCMGAMVFSGVTCSSEFGNPPLAPSLDSCFQTSCEAANIALVNVYITRSPHRDPSDRIDISYSTQAPYPGGEVTYSPNPLVQWRFDATTPGSMTASADLASNVSIRLAQTGTIDCSYSGHLEGTTSATDTMSTATMIFSKITRVGPVNVSVQNTSTAPRTGNIAVGATVLAKITENGVVWNTDCR